MNKNYKKSDTQKKVKKVIVKTAGILLIALGQALLVLLPYLGIPYRFRVWSPFAPYGIPYDRLFLYISAAFISIGSGIWLSLTRKLRNSMLALLLLAYLPCIYALLSKETFYVAVAAVISAGALYIYKKLNNNKSLH